MGGAGLGLGLALASSKRLRRGVTEIVAWGDSLTASAHASASAFRYPAVAGRLFDPPRAIVNQGIGGQTSAQIAARQGGRPIVCTLVGDAIPAAYDWSWDFSNGTAGFLAGGSAPIAELSLDAGALVIAAKGGANSRVAVTLASELPSGTSVTVSLQLVQGGHIEIGVGDQAGPSGGGSWSGPSHAMSGSGAIERTSILNKVGRSLLMYLGTSVGTSRISGLRMRTATPVAVSAKNVNVLFNSGAFSGTIAGTLAGIRGVMSTDASGAWAFTRSDAGAAAPCPPDSPFVPDDALASRSRSAWIWAGRNNFAEAAQVLADIAAMIAFLPHTRFLVGSVLNSAPETSGTSAYATILALNAQLAQTYGPRFVDLRGALIAAGGGGTDDQDIAAGIIPRSLRSDNTHLNDAGYAIVAAKMHAATMAQGW